jgi:hypothetical protein
VRAWKDFLITATAFVSNMVLIYYSWINLGNSLQERIVNLAPFALLVLAGIAVYSQVLLSKKKILQVEDEDKSNQKYKIHSKEVDRFDELKKNLNQQGKNGHSFQSEEKEMDPESVKTETGRKVIPASRIKPKKVNMRMGTTKKTKREHADTSVTKN